MIKKIIYSFLIFIFLNQISLGQKNYNWSKILIKKENFSLISFLASNFKHYQKMIWQHDFFSQYFALKNENQFSELIIL